MDFSLFIYGTVGRRKELEAGMAGRKPELYQRFLAELADYAKFADERDYYAIGHPEHHLQIEGFEMANDPCLMAMWLGQHLKRMRVMTCGFVASHQQSDHRGGKDRDPGQYAGWAFQCRPGARLSGALAG